MERLFRIFRSNAVQESAADDTDGVDDQARLMSVEGTMWYMVSHASDEGTDEDINQLKRWFPDSENTKFSKKWRQAMQDSGRVEADCKALLADHLQYIRDQRGRKDLEEKGVFFSGPVGDNILHLCYLLKKHKLGRYLVEVFGPDLVNFPYQKRRNLQDAPGLYEGEVVLHIAIVSKRLDEVEFLLENGADVQARAWGTFFAKGGTCYYGEFPLSFAVCMEQPEIIQALVDKGVDVDAQDSYGNTALHLAVIYSLPDMYELLADKHGADERIANNDGLSPLSLAASLNNTVMFDRILRYQRNMAWAYGPVTCFQTPLEDIDTVRIPGTEKDIRQQTRSVLKIICEKGNAELLKMPFINTVMEVKWQSFGKWIFFAHAALYAMLMITVSVLVAYQRQTDSGGFTVFGRAKKGTWYEDYQAAADDEKQLLGEELRLQKLHHETDSESQQTLETLEYAVLVLVALFAVLELYDLVKWIQEFVEESRWRRELRSETLKRCTHCMAEIRHPTRFNNDAADPATDGTAHLLGRTAKKAQPAEQRIQNWLEFWAQALAQRWQQSHPITFLLYAFIVLMVTHCFIWSYMSARPGWEPWPMYTVNVELSLAMICGWGYCLYFTSGFKNTGPLVVMMIQMMFRDVLKFMTIYLVLAVAFAQALYLIAEHEVPDDNLGNLSCNFCSVPDAMLTLFRFSLGDINYSLFYHPSAHQAMKFLFISWAMISNILLLNLLIALMNSTYEQVMEEGEQIWRRLWARLVLLQERRLPNSLRIRYRLGEAIKGSDGNERHMHVTVESDQSKETNDDATRAALDEVKAMLLEQRSTEQRLRPRTAHLARKQQEQLPEAQAGMNNLELIQRTAVLWRRKASGKK